MIRIRISSLTPRAIHAARFATLLSIVLFAGITPPASAQTSGTWTTTGSLNTPRQGHTATLLANNQVLVVGGTAAGGILNSAELYNPVTGRWTVTGNMATSRIDHSATLLPNGRVLVAGGENAAGPLNSAELYDSATGHWTLTGHMTVARVLHGATLLQNGQVLVAAGDISVGSTGATAEIYDSSRGAWKATGSLRSFHSFVLTVLQNGQALAVDQSDSSLTPGELYEPSTGQWRLTADMYYSQSGVSTALLSNGSVLVYGNKFSCYAGEVYDPFADTWTRALGNCGNAISHGPLSLLGTGKVLLAGETITYSGKAFPTANCRLYDPAANSWSLTGSLREAMGHTTTRLFDGRVLAVGGSDAELYTP